MITVRTRITLLKSRHNSAKNKHDSAKNRNNSAKNRKNSAKNRNIVILPALSDARADLHPLHLLHSHLTLDLRVTHDECECVMSVMVW